MAIMKMKKLRMLVLRSRKDELLRELIRHGCVEFSRLEERLKGSEAEELLSPQSSELASLTDKHRSLVQALEILNRYAPEKKHLLRAKPELENNILLDDTGLKYALRLAEKISGIDKRIQQIAAEQSKQHSQIQALKPWLAFKLPLNMEGTERCSIVIGSIPQSQEAEKISAGLEDCCPEAELFLINEDRQFRYVMLICLKEKLDELMPRLRHFDFSPAGIRGMQGTALQCKNQAYQRIEELENEKKHCIRRISDEAVHRDELKLAADRVEVKLSLCRAEESFYGTDSVLLMEGWLPEEREAEICRIFERFGCAYELITPSPEEYPEVPVRLKNNKLTNALNMVTNMYSLPAYGSLDPNPLMAPFFILFYGLMMADMGYGLMMILAALVAMAAIKPRAGALSFCQLLLYGGISTFVMGALTGGFFGDALVHVGKLLGKSEGWGTLPSLFTPIDDSIMVLAGALILGFIHLNTGMAISFVKKFGRRQYADALWEEGALWLTMLGAALWLLNIGTVQGIPLCFVVGAAAVLYGGSRKAKGFFGKLLSLFATVYNTATGWFGDILSYTRIMALMLAGSVIATVFNTIGTITNSLAGFCIIFIIGHSLNFGLNLLGCYVHDLRLQCLEFFNKFYEGGGKAFKPLELKTSYYNPAE